MTWPLRHEYTSTKLAPQSKFAYDLASMPLSAASVSCTNPELRRRVQSNGAPQCPQEQHLLTGPPIEIVIWKSFQADIRLQLPTVNLASVPEIDFVRRRTREVGQGRMLC